MAKAKRPTDANQRAKSIVDIATGEVEDTHKIQDGKNRLRLHWGGWEI